MFHSSILTQNPRQLLLSHSSICHHGFSTIFADAHPPNPPWSPLRILSKPTMAAATHPPNPPWLLLHILQTLDLILEHSK
ncbi:hypothetical protein Hanom_Chr16g01513491 [Helianthus anomalus]